MATVSEQTIKFGSIAMSLAGIRLIWDELNQLTTEQGDLELSGWVRDPEHSEEEFLQAKAHARANAFTILGTVVYENGVTLHDTDPSIIKIEPGGPNIELIYISNINTYQRYFNRRPEYFFELWLDLRNGPLMDARNILSAPTDNGTKLVISGTRPAWKAGVEAAVRNRIAKKRPIRTWFHGAFVYDLFLWLLGLPLGFYVCWAIGPSLNKALENTNTIVVNAAFIYLVICTIWAYRIMFGYAKWAFPLVEILDQPTKQKVHRTIWWFLIVSVVGKIFWSIIGASPLISAVWHV